MREQIPELTRKDMKELIPRRLLEELDKEAARLKEELLEKINYSKEIRLAYEPTGCTLSRIESDEMARLLFEYQLQNESLLNGVCGMKIQSGKESENVLLFIRRRVSKQLIEEHERDLVRRVRNRYFLESGSGPSRSDRLRKGDRGRGRGRDYADTGFYWPEDFQIAGMLTSRKDLGRTIIIGYIASEIGKDTKLLRACAARFQLLPALEMLELFDSIGFSTPAHIPDLFPAARSIRRHFIIHVGGTNTGKTYDSMEMLAHSPSGVYLSPLRMLAYEGREVIRRYGVKCSFATGEEKELEQGARHISETIGMLDYNHPYDCAVIDECQLISGEDGSLYTNAILGVNAPTVCVCCAYSGLEITKRLIELCGDTWEVIEHHRTSELKFEEEPFEGPRKNDAYIVFSRMGAHQMAEWLEEHGMTPSIVYGKLPYEVKMEEARKFEDGQTDCLVATDAIAIGQNYNIERIVFRDITKFINRREIRLDSQTVKQVAGRAGRYGRFPVGYVNTWKAADREEIRLKLLEEDVPSQTAPLELPAFLVEKELPLSLIYRAWTGSEAGEPFVKADTTTELFICRLIEEEYPSISKQNEYNLASLPLDLRDRTQLDLLRSLFSAMLRPTMDEEWKALLPGPVAIKQMVKWRPHLRDCEKLCRDLDLASSFFYKIRRDDLAEYVIHLKPPVTKRIAEIMSEEIPDHAPGEKPPVKDGEGVKDFGDLQEKKLHVAGEGNLQEKKSHVVDEGNLEEKKSYKVDEGGLQGKKSHEGDEGNLQGKKSYKAGEGDLKKRELYQGAENQQEKDYEKKGIEILQEKKTEEKESENWQEESFDKKETDNLKNKTSENRQGKKSDTREAENRESRKSEKKEKEDLQEKKKRRREAELASGETEKREVTSDRIPEEDTSKWPTAYIYVSTTGQTERNTARFPAGDWQKLNSRKLEQSFGNEASYIDYFCYKKKDRVPDYCRTDPYIRYTVKLDPQFIVSDQGACYLAERFLVVKSDYKEAIAPVRPKSYRNHGHRRRRR